MKRRIFGCSGFRSLFSNISLDSSPEEPVSPAIAHQENQPVKVQIFLNPKSGFFLIHCDRYKATRENMVSPDKRSQGTVARMRQGGDRENVFVEGWLVLMVEQSHICHIALLGFT